MAATVVYMDESVIGEATTRRKGIVSINANNGLTISGGTLGIRLATLGSYGTVMPDGTTITSAGGVISTKDYDSEIAELTRRIEELEEAVAGGMTYEDGTLFTNAAYDGGTLVTDRTYDDGTLS